MPAKTAPAKKTPAKKAAPRKALTPTPVSEWKVKNDPLELPSGKVMLFRRVGMQAFMKAGIINNDLMSQVQDAIDGGEENTDMVAIASNMGQMSQMLSMVDEVVIFSAIEPEVHEVPTKRDQHGVSVEDVEAREDDVLYIDEIEEEDKMFIFGFLTSGVRDVEQFRREQAELLGTLPGR